MKIHPVFHVSKLLPYKAPQTFSQDRPVPSRPPSLAVKDQEEYEVEEIKDHHTWRKKLQFLIKWKGYPDHENT